MSRGSEFFAGLKVPRLLLSAFRQTPCLLAWRQPVTRWPPTDRRPGLWQLAAGSWHSTQQLPLPSIASGAEVHIHGKLGCRASAMALASFAWSVRGRKKVVTFFLLPAKLGKSRCEDKSKHAMLSASAVRLVNADDESCRLGYLAAGRKPLVNVLPFQ